MQFYDFRLAPSPTKVRIFIAEKGLESPTVDVNLREGEQRAAEFRARVPCATVPALELDDGTVLVESHAICRYLEEIYPETNLLGTDAKEQALVLMWHDIALLEGYLGIQEVLRNSLDAFAGRALPGPVSYEQIKALVERGKKRTEAFFDKLNQRLAESPYVALDRFTYADISAYVYQGFATRATGENPAEARDDLARWHETIAARPAVKAATS
jgi:glutathione S-transferase